MMRAGDRKQMLALSPCIDSSSELHDMFDFMFEQMDLYVFGLSFANAAALLCKHYC